MTKKQDRSLSQDYHRWAETIMCFGCGEAIDLNDDSHICDYYDTNNGLMYSDCAVKIVHYLCFNKKNKKSDRMTEKRFKLEDIGFVRDNEKLIGMKDIVAVMNDLQEENERLKNRLKQAIREINDHTCTIKQLQDKIDVKEALLKQYEEENDQLEQENEKLENRLWNCQNVR